MLQDKLLEMLELHKKWLNEETGGVRADFSGADLYRVNLFSASLREANFEGAQLHDADLRDTDLRQANFRKAVLTKANLQWACLERADLEGANLENANLRLTYTDMANLKDTNLTGAKINWNSHYLISELLFRDADNDSRHNAAKIVRYNPNVCWDGFLSLYHPEKEWALTVLRQYVSPDDECDEWIVVRKYLNPDTH